MFRFLVAEDYMFSSISKLLFLIILNASSLQLFLFYRHFHLVLQKKKAVLSRGFKVVAVDKRNNERVVDIENINTYHGYLVGKLMCLEIQNCRDIVECKYKSNTALLIRTVENLLSMLYRFALF